MYEVIYVCMCTRVNKVQGFGHGNEDFLIDSLGHAELAHELSDAELVLLVDEGLALQKHGQQRGGRLQLLLYITKI